MSYAQRDLKFKSTAQKTFTLLSGSGCVGRVYGGRVTDGGLHPHFGCKNSGFTGVPSSITAGYAAGNGTICLYAEGNLYYKTAEQSAFTVAASGLEKAPYFYETADGITASDGAVNVVISDDTVTQTEAQMALYGSAVHYERLFGVDADGYTVRWSAAGTVDGWEEGIRNSGWLKLPPSRGKILRLVPFDDKLVAVRERGLTIIKAYGSTENFRIINSDADMPEITADSIAVCAGKLFFATKQGLYAWDGSDIERVAESGLCGTGEIICGAACGNYYFASLTIGQKKVVACIDGENGETSFIDFSADCLFAGGTAYAAADGVLYTIYSPAEEASYESGYTDFGEAGRKYLKYVIIDGGAGGSLTVENGVNSRIFAGVTGKVKVGMPGDKFCFTLTAPCAVKSVTAVYEI